MFYGLCAMTLSIVGTFWRTNREHVVFEKCSQCAPNTFIKKEEHDCQTLGLPGSNIGCMVHKERQPKPSQCYNMVRETNVPQIVTRRSDMLNEGCIS